MSGDLVNAVMVLVIGLLGALAHPRLAFTVVAVFAALYILFSLIGP